MSGAYLLGTGPWAALVGTQGDRLAPQFCRGAGVLFSRLVCIIQKQVLNILVPGPQLKLVT